LDQLRRIVDVELGQIVLVLKHLIHQGLIIEEALIVRQWKLIKHFLFSFGVLAVSQALLLNAIFRLF